MASIGEVKGVSGKVEEPGAQKPGLAERVKNYFTELMFEGKKITFPTGKEWRQSTIVVFVFTFLLMGIISLLDIIVGFIFRTLILPA